MSNPGQELARKRWDHPDQVEKRVQSLALSIRAKLDRLPPLTQEQKQRLTAIINS